MQHVVEGVVARVVAGPAGAAGFGRRGRGLEHLQVFAVGGAVAALGQELGEQCAHGLPLAAVRGDVHQVLLFVGIVRQVKEQFAAAG